MSDPQALVGQSLSAKYQVRRLLGRGGMGSVYEGQNIEIGKRVAIKTIDQFHAMSHELATRLRREARAAAAVESNHIVQVFDVGEDPKCGVYMVMEFLAGEDLGAKLQREGRLEAPMAVNIAIQVCRALVKAHGAGIVHRDLKPGNVFLTEKEEGGLLVKVVDFGISKLLRDDATDGQKNLTRMGTALGTPQYMSPEQAAGNTNIDHRTDIWALGCLLYEMLAGRPPYEDAGTYEMTIVRILTTRPPPLQSVAPWVQPSLAQVVDSTLVHEWAQRMPDALTLLRSLSDAMQLDPSTGTGRHSAVQVPQYLTGPMAVYQKPPTPVALDATMPMSGEHEALIAKARAEARAQSGSQQQLSGQYTGARKPISTETAVIVAPSASHSAILASSASHPAVAVDDAPAAGVPSRGGAAILFIGLGALVVALGVGGWFMFGREPAKPTPAAKAVETAAVEKDKSDKTEKTAKPEEKKPEPPPSVSAVPTSTAKAPLFPTGKGKFPGPGPVSSGKAQPTAVASGPGVPPAPSGKSTGSGFGGAGVSENY
ncbi:MAG: protein kinase domain-containing protein [Polyangiales bacterium]